LGFIVDAVLGRKALRLGKYDAASRDDNLTKEFGEFDGGGMKERGLLLFEPRDDPKISNDTFSSAFTGSWNL
jgi:hypothetical protein